MVKLTILHDEYTTFIEERAGFSILIEIAKKKILFDTSMNNDIILNAHKGNVDLSTIDYVVFSHGHYDHTDGLKYLDLTGISHIVAHPDCFKKRFVKEKEREIYIGIPFFLEYLQRETDLVQSKAPFWIIEDEVVFLGEIPRKNNFEAKKPLGYLENGDPDYINDDSALVIKSDQGLIIISGCSHSGICNIIEYAKEVCKDERIYVVMGGMHLFEENRIPPTINYLKGQKIRQLYAAHCLSDLGFSEMEKIGARRIHTLEEFNF